MANHVVSVLYEAKVGQYKTDVASAADSNKKLGDAASGAGQRAGASMERMGTTMTRRVTPAAAVMGAGFGLAFREFDEGADTLAAKTGAVGDELDSLTASMKSVASSGNYDFAQVGAVMGDLAARTKLTGEPLERLTTQVLDLQTLGQNVTVEGLTASLAKGGVEAEDMADALDLMYRVATTTGTPVDQLSGLLEKFGVQLAATGLPLEDQVLLLGQLEAGGVNTAKVMTGLNAAINEISAAGGDPAEGLADLFTEIENAGSAAEANTIAVEAFGAKAGPELASAISNGTLSLDEMRAALDANDTSVREAALGTYDLIDKAKMMANTIVGVIGPVSEYGMIVSGLAMGAGPAISALGKMSSVVGGMSGVADKAASALYSLAGASRQQAITSGIAAAAAGGLIYGLMEQRATTEQNARVVAGFADQINEGGDAVSLFSDAISGALSSDDDLRDMLNAAGENAGSLAEAVAAGGTEWETFRQRLLDTGEASDFGAIKLDQLASVYRDGTNAAEEAAAATEEVEVAVESAAEMYAGPLLESLDSAMRGYQDLTAAADRYNDAIRAQFDPVFALQDALSGHAEAQTRLTELQATGTATTAELDEANRGLLDASLGVVTATNDFNAAAAENPALVADATAAIEGLAAAGLLTSQEAEAAAAKLRDVDAAAGDLESAAFVIGVDADTSAAWAKVTAFTQALASGVFGGFAGFFTGNASALGIAPAVQNVVPGSGYSRSMLSAGTISEAPPSGARSHLTVVVEGRGDTPVSRDNVRQIAAEIRRQSREVA